MYYKKNELEFKLRKEYEKQKNRYFMFSIFMLIICIMFLLKMVKRMVSATDYFIIFMMFLGCMHYLFHIIFFFNDSNNNINLRNLKKVIEVMNNLEKIIKGECKIIEKSQIKEIDEESQEKFNIKRFNLLIDEFLNIGFFKYTEDGPQVSILEPIYTAEEYYNENVKCDVI